jgi:hypothetical protein
MRFEPLAHIKLSDKVNALVFHRAALFSGDHRHGKGLDLKHSIFLARLDAAQHDRDELERRTALLEQLDLGIAELVVKRPAYRLRHGFCGRLDAAEIEHGESDQFRNRRPIDREGELWQNAIGWISKKRRRTVLNHCAVPRSQ